MREFLKGLEQVQDNVFSYIFTNKYQLDRNSQLTHLVINYPNEIDFTAIVTIPTLRWLNLQSNNLTELPESIAKLLNCKIYKTSI